MKRALAFTLMVLAIMIIAVSCEEPQVHVHTYSDKWECDDTYHWHEATCEDTDEVDGKEAHKFGNLIPDVAATESTTGKGHRVCSVCGYKRNEEISALGHSHKLSSVYSKDATGHWQTCSGCNSKVNYSAHTISCVSADDLEHDYKCSVCDYVEKTETHSLVQIEDLTTGEKEQSCKKCSYKKSLAAVVTESKPVATKTVDDNTVNSGTVEITAAVSASEQSSSSSSSSSTSGEPKKETKVTFPAESLKMNENATSVSLTVKAVAITEVSSDSDFKVTTTTTGSDETTSSAVVAGFEFTLEGADSSDFGSSGVTVSTYINPGLTKNDIDKYEDTNTLKILYTGSESTGKAAKITKYITSTGYLEYKVYHFSRYAIVSSEAVAVDETGKIYRSLDDAVKVDSTGSTITLLKDVQLGTGITIPNKKTVTIDLNSKILGCGTSKSASTITALTIDEGGDLTIKNGTLSYYGNNTGCQIIVNRGKLTTSKLTASAKISATETKTMTLDKAISDSNSCDTVALISNCGTLALNSSTFDITVSLVTKDLSITDSKVTFAAAKPIVLYLQAGSEATLNGTTLSGTTDAPGGILGLYGLVNDESDEGITADITGSTISLTNNSFGWTRPVFADGRNASRQIDITVGNSIVTAKDTVTDTTIKTVLTSSGLNETDANNVIKLGLRAKYNRVYGLRSTGNSVIRADEKTLTNITITIDETEGATAIPKAGELTDYEGSARAAGSCGCIISKDKELDVGVMTATDDTSLENNIKYAKEGATIQLLDDISLTSDKSTDNVWYTINRSLTLDLGGKTLSADRRVFNVASGAVTVKNGTIEVSSKYPEGRFFDNCVISVGNTNNEVNGEIGLIIGADAIINGLNCYGISAISKSNATLEINGTINSANVCVSGYGKSDEYPGKITVTVKENAKLTSYGETITKTDDTIETNSNDKNNKNYDDACAIYQPNVGGTLNIEGGNITSKKYSAIEVRNGNANICGGTLVSEAKYEVGETPTDGGPCVKGAAVAVDYYGTNVDKEGNGITVTITGGTFTADHGKRLAIVKTVDNYISDTSKVKAVVADSLNFAEAEIFGTKGASEDGKTTWTVGTTGE